jgi:DNA helicase-2/ATP-dependent DNA helicase PcrA
MAKLVILAVAGAGKTYHICHSIDPAKRNLILAFTNENVFNIQRELIDAFGSIPKYTVVSTFHSFVYHNLILPYEPSIASYFECDSFASKGITTLSPPPQSIKVGSRKAVANPRYFAKTKLRHYVDDGSRYYCAALSELALQVKCRKVALVSRASRRLNLFYDACYIDEFQDFRGHDYDLIVNLAKRLNEVTLVGDYYQHSVSGRNNTGKPFAKNKTVICYSDFLDGLRKEGFEIDEASLRLSRRCAPSICSFVQDKLAIRIDSAGCNKGEIIWVSKNLDAILTDDTITKLVYQESNSFSFRSVNWSYSKGDTFDSVCVILTKNFENLDDEGFSIRGISDSTINKLYVALTRSRGNVYLIKASAFDSVKEKYR